MSHPPARPPAPASHDPGLRRTVRLLVFAAGLVLAGQIWWSQIGELRRSLGQRHSGLAWPDVADPQYARLVDEVARHIPPDTAYLHLASWPRERRMRIELFDRIAYTGSRYQPLHEAGPDAILEVMRHREIRWLLVDPVPSPFSPFAPPPAGLAARLLDTGRLHPVPLGPTASGGVHLLTSAPEPAGLPAAAPPARSPLPAARRGGLPGPVALVLWTAILAGVGLAAVGLPPAAGGGAGNLALRGATAALAGAVLVHLAAQLLTLAGVPLALTSWPAAALLLALIARLGRGIGCAAAGKCRQDAAPATSRAAAVPLPGVPAPRALAVVIGLQLAYLVVLTAARPLQDGDALADWVYKARAFERARAIELAPPAHPASGFHSYYPTLIPALGALGLMLGGEADPEQLRWQGLFWFALFLAGLDGIARRAGAGGQTRLALLALLLASGHLLYEHASTAMADLPLAAAVALLLAQLPWPGAEPAPERGVCSLAGAFALTAACACKLEGTPQAGILILPLLLVSTRRHGARQALRAAAPLAGAAALALLPWLLLLLRAGIRIDSEHIDRFRLSGLPEIAGAMLAAPAHPYYWGVLAPGALALWLTHRSAGSRPVPGWIAAALGLEVALIAGAYLFTSYHGPQLRAQIGYTLNRLYLHVLPVAWLALAFLARPPRPAPDPQAGLQAAPP